MSDDLKLKPEVAAWLNDMRPEEVHTISEIVGMIHSAGDGVPEVGVERIRAALAFARRMEGTKKIMQTIILAGVGALAALAAIPDQIKAVLAWLSRLGGAK